MTVTITDTGDAATTDHSGRFKVGYGASASDPVDVHLKVNGLQAEGGPYHAVLERLRAQGHVVEREGAVWFASSQLGEEKNKHNAHVLFCFRSFADVHSATSLPLLI